MSDYWCHLCGKRTGMMGHALPDGTYSCQEPAKPKLTSGYVKLTEDYGEFEKGTVFTIKHERELSYSVHIAKGETLYVPKSLAERITPYYDPTI